MTKKVAVINDLSGLGRCSLTAAISVLSAMGIQACPLPTAILSSQTEYPSYYCYDFTDKMDYFRQEWKKLGTSFSGIYTGYVASVCQIEQIMHFLDTFQTADTFLLVDPVMGDDGVTYDMYTSGLLTAMKELVARADVITPNLTEFCLLTDIDYNSLQDSSLSIQQLISRLKDAGQTLTKDHEKKVLITGIHFTADDGVHKIGNLLLDGSSHFLSAYPCCNGSYSGTGDLFASCITGGLARDISLTEMMQTAGSFLEKSLIDSVEEHVPVNEGVNFENISCIHRTCHWQLLLHTLVLKITIYLLKISLLKLFLLIYGDLLYYWYLRLIFRYIISDNVICAPTASACNL